MILTCGEALMDVFAQTTTGQEQQSNSLHFHAVAGGSLMSVAKGIERLGQRASFMGPLSSDQFGDFLKNELISEGVDLSYLVTTGQPTAIAFIFNNEQGVPTYHFYGHNTADLSLNLQSLPKTLGDDITCIHTGSFVLVLPPICDTLEHLIAREKQTRLISLDLNIRPSLIGDPSSHIDRLERLIAQSHIVKASTEDISLLYGSETLADPERQARKWQALGAKLVMITEGEKGAFGLWKEHVVSASAPSVKVVDTVGAGDTFQAAMLAGLKRFGWLSLQNFAEIHKEGLRQIMEAACRAAAITCSRRGADLPTLDELNEFGRR